MKYLKIYEDFDNSEYPFYLGKGKIYYDIKEDDILSVGVYVENPEKEGYLKNKMEIDKKDLLFNKSDGFMEVWSKVDPGEHSKGETSILVKSKKDSMFKGKPYRGIILKESYNSVDKLIEQLREALLPEYTIDVFDLDKKYINDPRNKTKSTKCIEIRKDDDIYLDFYYDEFTPSKLKEEAQFWIEHRGRDMDPVTLGHFKKISQIIIELLNP
jgi:hypothetical protein